MNKRIWIPKLNVYTHKLSIWQEKLWNLLIPRSHGERWDSDHYSFCNAAYGMTSERIKKYSFTLEPQKPHIQKMTAACVWNASNAAAGGGISQEINSTITVGSIQYDSFADTSGVDYAYLYGYKVASSYHPIVTFASSSGSIGDGVYTDGNSTSQTITAVGWSDNGVSGTPAAETDNIYFGLNGTSRGDTDAVMTKFDYNGTEYTRSSRDIYTASVGGGETFWEWSNVATNGPTSGTVNFDLWVT